MRKDLQTLSETGMRVKDVGESCFPLSLHWFLNMYSVDAIIDRRQGLPHRVSRWLADSCGLY